MNDFERGMQYQQMLARDHLRHIFVASLPRDTHADVAERQKLLDAEIARTRDNTCRRHLARIQVYGRRIADLNQIIHRSICDNRLNPHAHSAATLAAMKANMDRLLKQKDEELRRLQELGGVVKPKSDEKPKKEAKAPTKNIKKPSVPKRGPRSRLRPRSMRKLFMYRLESSGRASRDLDSPWV